WKSGLSRSSGSMSRQRHRRAWVAVGLGGMSGPGRDHGASSPAPRNRAQYASSSSAVRVAWTAMIALLLRSVSAELRALTAPVQAGSVVPQELSFGLVGDRAPAEDRLDRLRKPALRVWIVRAEHQRVRAEQLDDAPHGAFALVHLDTLEELRPAHVVARLPRQMRDAVLGHLRHFSETNPPPGHPAVAGLHDADSHRGEPIEHPRTRDGGDRTHARPHATGGALQEDVVPEIGQAG